MSPAGSGTAHYGASRRKFQAREALLFALAMYFYVAGWALLIVPLVLEQGLLFSPIFISLAIAARVIERLIS